MGSGLAQAKAPGLCEPRQSSAGSGVCGGCAGRCRRRGEPWGGVQQGASGGRRPSSVPSPNSAGPQDGNAGPLSSLASAATLAPRRCSAERSAASESMRGASCRSPSSGGNGLQGTGGVTASGLAHARAPTSASQPERGRASSSASSASSAQNIMCFVGFFAPPQDRTRKQVHRDDLPSNMPCYCVTQLGFIKHRWDAWALAGRACLPVLAVVHAPGSTRALCLMWTIAMPSFALYFAALVPRCPLSSGRGSRDCIAA